VYKIAHIADTHIKNLKFHYEYKIVFEQLYETLRKENVDYIVHCGDIAHTKTQISPEFVELCSDFFANLAKIAPTYIILGNHDGNLKNSTRQDALSPIVKALNLPDLHLLKNAGEVLVGPHIAFNVLSVFDEENWVAPSDPDRINIALYHGSVSGVKTDTGWVMTHGDHDVGIFGGHDYALLGDIHKTNQILDADGRVRYAGSTVQQNHGETNDKGFLIWEIEDKETFRVSHHVLLNPKPFVTIELTPKGRMPKGTKIPAGARLRLVSNNNLPLDVMRKAVEVAKHRFKPESITFLNRAAGERGTVEIGASFKVENLRDKGVQENLIREYLVDYQPSEEMLERVFELNRKYNSQIEETEEVARNVNWNLNKFEWDNLFNYGEGNAINFANLNGIVGIFGKNFSGKSSVIDGLLYTIFNTTSKNERKNYNIINQNRKNCRGLVELQVGDKIYTIERSSEKYIKKLKGAVTNEAKTNLEFLGTELDVGEPTSLNGLSRTETDAHIRKRFGTIEDFLLTSMSSQLDSLSFIKEGSTRRKEILAKFLDLDIFERKFRASHEDSADLKGLLRRLKNTDYDNDIAIAEVQEAESRLDLNKKVIIYAQAREDLSAAELEYQELTEQIESIPAERLDIKTLLESRSSLTSKIEDTNINITELKQENVGYNEKLKEYDDFLTTIDIEELLQKKKEYDDFKQKYDNTVNRARLMDNEYKVMSKKIELLDEVPCGDAYPMCRFINDAHLASVELPSLEVDVINEIEDAKVYKTKIVSVDSAEMITIIDNYNDTIIRKNNIEIEKRDNKVSIERLYAKIKTHRLDLEAIDEKIELYEEKKELIRNIENLLSSRGNVQKTIESLKESLISLDDLINDHHRQIGSLEQKVESLLEKREELENIREEYTAYDLFMRCMHSNGIAYDIIKKRLPVINEEIAKVLSNIVDFEAYFQEDGRKLDILIKHPRHESRPIEMGSGAEKTVAAMAIRLALLSVSSLPKGNIFILDEPGTALDEENMEGFIRILQLIKMYFKTVILISHVDSLKDIVDMEISIDKINGYATVNQ
jgi:DNA repair exonuclease SbcCD nuclease subunit/ABC-type dipeptide/oligopeptide/nickel transport system ATPase component